jgi:hypothetical protein
MDIWIRESRARSLLTSAIEVYNRETDGVFSGKFVRREIRGKRRQVLYVENAYPLQTAERKPSQVYHGNILAFKRVMNSLATAGIEYIGGYHSHPHPYKGVRLSLSDVNFVKDELDLIQKSRRLKTQKNWVEILMCIKRVRYQQRQETAWKQKRQGKRVLFSLTITPYTKYEVIMTAFQIDFAKRPHEIREVRVHVERD